MHTFRRTGCVCMHMHARRFVYLLVYTPCVHIDVGRCVPIGGPAMYACVCEEAYVFMHPVANCICTCFEEACAPPGVQSVCAHSCEEMCISWCAIYPVPDVYLLVCHISCEMCISWCAYSCEEMCQMCVSCVSHIFVIYTSSCVHGFMYHIMCA